MKFNSEIKKIIDTLEVDEDYNFEETLILFQFQDGSNATFNYKTFNFVSYDKDSKWANEFFKVVGKEFWNNKKSDVYFKRIEERRILLSYLKRKNITKYIITESESPDFFAIINGQKIGIEVTQHITSAEAKCDRLARNPSKYHGIDIRKKFRNEVSQFGLSAFSPNQTESIDKLALGIPNTINKKIDKIHLYQNVSNYVVVVNISNPLINVSDYKQYIIDNTKEKCNKVKVVVMNDRSNFENLDYFEY